MKLHHIATDDQIVDILTKPLRKGKLLVFREQLGLMDVAPPDKGQLLIEDTKRILPTLFELPG